MSGGNARRMLKQPKPKRRPNERELRTHGATATHGLGGRPSCTNDPGDTLAQSSSRLSRGTSVRLLVESSIYVVPTRIATNDSRTQRSFCRTGDDRRISASVAFLYSGMQYTQCGVHMDRYRHRNKLSTALPMASFCAAYVAPAATPVPTP